MLTFFVPGKPVGKGRPRIGRVGQHARMFTPAATVSYENLVRMMAHQAMEGLNMLEGPCLLVMKISCQIPASWPKKKQMDAAAGVTYPTTKPDIDNVVKAICDALNGVVWKDDVQVCTIACSKVYSVTPGVDVTVKPL